MGGSPLRPRPDPRRRRKRFDRTVSGDDIMTDERNPLHHTRKMAARLKEAIDHMRADIEKVDEPQFKAMFETSAEVLGGLVKAFGDYGKKNEGAWTSSGKESRGVPPGR